jgi:hypothetical protein
MMGEQGTNNRARQGLEVISLGIQDRSAVPIPLPMSFHSVGK